MTDNNLVQAFLNCKNWIFNGITIILIQIVRLIITFFVINNLAIWRPIPLFVFFFIAINIVMIVIGILDVIGKHIRGIDTIMFYLNALSMILVVKILEIDNDLKVLEEFYYIHVSPGDKNALKQLWFNYSAIIMCILSIWVSFKNILGINNTCERFGNLLKRKKDLKDKISEINKEVAEINRFLGEDNNVGIIPNIIGGDKILSVNGIKDIFKDHNPLAK